MVLGYKILFRKQYGSKRDDSVWEPVPHEAISLRGATGLVNGFMSFETAIEVALDLSLSERYKGCILTILTLPIHTVISCGAVKQHQVSRSDWIYIFENGDTKDFYARTIATRKHKFSVINRESGRVVFSDEVEIMVGINPDEDGELFFEDWLMSNRESKNKHKWEMEILDPRWVKNSV